MVDTASLPESNTNSGDQQPPPPPKRDSEEHDHGSSSSISNSKRSKREWMAYNGARHTRVGADYQVAALPTPTATAKSPQQAEKEEPEGETNECNESSTNE